ncbi:hypothetical protein [Aeromonas veronii]|uniref:hypothetical protein n=1 Tax=Aeromonas veronii TaxID=654 RepID=UPI002B4680B3|nr:hypothetical protein [Aeromonas veronii]
MVVNFIQRCVTTIKGIMLFYQSHNIAVSTVSIVTFTSCCYFIVTSYFSNFGLDFFIFGSVADLYQVALYHGVIIKLILLSQFLIIIPVTLYIFFTKSVELEKSTDIKTSNIYRYSNAIKKKFFANAISLSEIWKWFMVAIFLIGLLSSPAFLLLLSKYSAEDVKNGLSARYSIETNKKLIPCLSVIGATSSYVFIWDDKTKMPSALPKPEIKTINLVVPPPPSNRAPSPNGDYKKKVKLQRELQEQWSSKLEETCHQSVKWHEW